MSPLVLTSQPLRWTSTVELLRPRQWLKNVLVFAAPAAAGVLDDPADLARTVVAFVAFCLAASGTYCLNDVADVEVDRLHTTKQHRPVADRRVPARFAVGLGAGLIGAALATSAVIGSWQLIVTVGLYVTVTTAYTYWLKQIAVIDVAAVAFGFVIRAVAGAAATDVELSDWFLIVACFGSLFMVSGKRWVELTTSDHPVDQRAVLGQYPPQFLVYLRSVSSGVTMLAYTLFAFDRAEGMTSSVAWFEVSIIPFVLAILRYALRVEQGDGDAPEELILADRTLQVLAALWGASFLTGVYAG